MICFSLCFVTPNAGVAGNSSPLTLRTCRKSGQGVIFFAMMMIHVYLFCGMVANHLIRPGKDLDW